MLKTKSDIEKSFSKYQIDLKALIEDGGGLYNAMLYACHKEQFEGLVGKQFKTKADLKTFVDGLPDFDTKYQEWYSESYVLLKQLMPDRLADFVRLYEKPKGRKEIKYGNYVMEDYLQGLQVTDGYGELKVDRAGAITQFQQQLNIVKAISKRFESSLFDIRQLVQADLFDNELDAARELLKNKFVRAAGAIAGVVLESHLEQVSINHSLVMSKKTPTLNDWNSLLKDNAVIETPEWRRIQHLADLRNLCDHKKTKEPSEEDIDDLINGVDKISKTLF